MAENTNELKSEFEFKPEYWLEAEKLIIKEEKRRKKIAWFWGLSASTIAGIAAVFFISINSQSGIKENNSLSSYELSEKKQDLTSKNAAVTDQSLKNQELGAQNLENKGPEVAISEKNENQKINSIYSEYLSAIPSDEKNTRTADIESPTLTNEKEEKTAVKNKFFTINPLSLAYSNLNKDIQLLSKFDSNYPKKKKENSFEKEIYISMMAYPNHGLGEKKDIMELSFNAGFMVSKNIYKGWSLATGIQYNNYRSIYQFEMDSSYITKEKQTIIDYVNNSSQKDLEPVSSGITPAGGTEPDAVFVIANQNSSTTTPLIINSNTTISASDTINLTQSTLISEANVYQVDVSLRVDRNVKEKLVKVGAIFIPLEAQYRYNNFRLAAGAAFEMLLFNKVKYISNDHIGSYLYDERTSEAKNNFSSVNKYLWYGSIGLDYYINSRFSFGTKACIGLNDISNNSYFNNKTFDRNYNLNLSLRYHW